MALLKEISEIASTKADLKKFGLTMAAALSLFGGLAAWHQRPFYIYLIEVAVLFLIVGLLLPVVLRPVQKAWMTLALLIGWVMSRLILIVIFYFVLTPIGLFLRLSGKDLLGTKLGISKTSYWQIHGTRDKTRYENQF